MKVETETKIKAYNDVRNYRIYKMKESLTGDSIPYNDVVKLIDEQLLKDDCEYYVFKMRI